MSAITVKEVDDIILELTKKQMEKEDIAEALSNKNKEISSLEIHITGLLDSLERSEYDSPHGKVSFNEELSVKQPLDENKHLLWSWMKERGIFERYAQVHATALKSLFKAEREIAIENGEDPLTFSLPGCEPASTFRKLKFKARRNS